jgi:arylesterase/paraoxonase
MAGTKTKISLGLLVAFLAAVYQVYVKSILAYTGVYPNRIIENIGNDNCEAVKGLKGCESAFSTLQPSSLLFFGSRLTNLSTISELVIHQPTGIIYLACSDPHDRRLWTPYFDLLDPAGSGSGYVAQYNPSTKKVTKMTFAGLEPKSQYSAHGMDVVPSSVNPDELWFYLINHRAPHPSKGKPSKIGADSVVQIFKSAVPGRGKASERLVWIKTFNNKHIHTPNDVVGSPDGKSFYFTNDHSARVGWVSIFLSADILRSIEQWLFVI